MTNHISEAEVCLEDAETELSAASKFRAKGDIVEADSHYLAAQSEALIAIGHTLLALARLAE